MQDTNRQVDQLQRTVRRLKLTCGSLAAVVVLGAGMAMQAGLDGGEFGQASMFEAAVPVHDSTGYAVFARRDGNIIIVKEDGTVIRTQNQPLSPSF